MNTCGTCKHWKKPEERTAFGNVVNFHGDNWDMDKEDWDGQGYERGDADDKKFGFCGLIDLGESLPLDQPTPLAVTQDASRYSATLYTQAEFGCVLHEEVVDEGSGKDSV